MLWAFRTELPDVLYEQSRVLTKQSVSPSWRQWLKAAEYSADVVVGGKAFQCYESQQATYDLLIAQPPGSAQLVITLHAEGVTPHTRLFPIDPATVQAIGEVLRAREEAPAAALEPASTK